MVEESFSERTENSTLNDLETEVFKSSRLGPYARGRGGFASRSWIVLSPDAFLCFPFRAHSSFLHIFFFDLVYEGIQAIFIALLCIIVGIVAGYQQVLLQLRSEKSQRFLPARFVFRTHHIWLDLYTSFKVHYKNLEHP